MFRSDMICMHEHDPSRKYQVCVTYGEYKQARRTNHNRICELYSPFLCCIFLCVQNNNIFEMLCVCAYGYLANFFRVCSDRGGKMQRARGFEIKSFLAVGKKSKASKICAWNLSTNVLFENLFSILFVFVIRVRSNSQLTSSHICSTHRNYKLCLHLVERGKAKNFWTKSQRWNR